MTSFDWKKNIEDYQRRTDCNCHNHRNIFRTKGGKRKASKGISACHGYHETCRWNLWKSISERLCSLQERNQGVIQKRKIL